MDLLTENGSISLEIAHRQFPDLPLSATSWSDGNWLVIRGTLTDGTETWQFEDPCLLVSEAQELAEWLRAPSGRLRFIEPNLALDADRCGNVTLHLSYECAPAGPASLALPMTPEQLGRAADAWLASLGAVSAAPAA